MPLPCLRLHRRSFAGVTPLSGLLKATVWLAAVGMKPVSGVGRGGACSLAGVRLVGSHYLNSLFVNASGALKKAAHFSLCGCSDS